MTTYSTKINQIKVIAQDQKLRLENIVFTVSFTVTGKDGELNHSVTREIGLATPDPSNFIPLEKLTNEQMLVFMNDALAPDDMRCIQNEIDETILKQKNSESELSVVKWDR